jgi:hypothetical protein
MLEASTINAQVKKELGRDESSQECKPDSVDHATVAPNGQQRNRQIPEEWRTTAAIPSVKTSAEALNGRHSTVDEG